jgi:ergothioneine biosynthesis protein EgtB
MTINTALDERGVDPASVASSRYRQVRGFTESLTASLEPEDCIVQSMPDASPTRWHLAHTTWFFECFLLRRFVADYTPLDEAYEHLFNSYYNAVGPQFPRPRRGLLSRPTVRDIYRYRQSVDEQVSDLLEDSRFARDPEILRILEIGLHHEQQHQELILTDIKHVFSCNPLYPAFRPREKAASKCRPAGMARPGKRCDRRDQVDRQEVDWHTFAEGLHAIGHDGVGFAFDNEGPRHRQFVPAFQLADRLVSNGEYREFMQDGGYRRPEFWLSEGWATVQSQGWRAPLYWIQCDGRWRQFTLNGLESLADDEPVCHVSYYEADAFTRLAGARLPREAEWERAACEQEIARGNFVESGLLRPAAPADDVSFATPRQMFGDVWEWTASAYAAYPGYQPPEGALGEYNGKFMCNQYVLRGGSCAASRSHIRRTYRNFFPPEARWQFSGIRLARDVRPDA